MSTPESIRQYQKDWRERNRETLRVKKKAYYEEHAAENRQAKNKRDRERYWTDPEKSRARCREKAQRLYATDKEIVLSRSRAWAKRNPALKHSLWKSWARKNPDKVRANTAKRRARKKRAGFGDPKLIAAWVARVRRSKNRKCHWCESKLTLSQVRYDHIIALSKGGAHSVENLCVSCESCNSQKYNKSLSEWRSEGQTFLNL